MSGELRYDGQVNAAAQPQATDEAAGGQAWRIGAMTANGTEGVMQRRDAIAGACAVVRTE